ncbi:MAG: FAD-dependent oxidoreductase [Verrucomicrobiales bacterium]|nr:FAD-dependent oxidoreductase [Verrucomicrobiales bacterium]
MRAALPSQTGAVVIGAGIAGASVAAALTRAGLHCGLVLEREPLPGTHASGRNAAIARQLERHPALLRLTVAGVRRLAGTCFEGRPVLHRTGGVYLGQGDTASASELVAGLHAHGVPAEILLPLEAWRRFPFLQGFAFRYAIFCPTDGIVDIHALLIGLLAEARQGGFEVITECTVGSLLLEGSRVAGVRTARGEVRTQLVVDASGAWAGRLGRESSPLPLQPLRRHLFVGEPGGSSGPMPRGAPFVWDLDAGYYVRPESGGLLMCPCDEAEHPPGVPAPDPAAAELLADKILNYSPGLGDVVLHRSWACLRTFAPDRLPTIGWDADIPGLFHVSGLGGYGITTSLAAGDLAAALIDGAAAGEMDASAFSPRRAEVVKGR